MSDEGQKWAEMIRKNSRDSGVSNVIDAVNAATESRLSNRSDVMVACAQILAQNIVAEAFISAEIRMGIMSLIDGYAMKTAIIEQE